MKFSTAILTSVFVSLAAAIPINSTISNGLIAFLANDDSELAKRDANAEARYLGYYLFEPNTKRDANSEDVVKREADAEARYLGYYLFEPNTKRDANSEDFAKERSRCRSKILGLLLIRTKHQKRC
ncbi:hypothetical protein QCA50_020923 [Cerrena zonata]|uniref:Uncharacterized protein n=1 Tax=Cerrena zonata TaxID=2478898 RepID=A0AAW0F712_9APHY